MIEVAPNIYQVEIPLEGNPLKAIHSYILVEEDESGQPTCHIVDTGFNAQPCKEALMSALETLNVSLKKSKLIITHLHSDHSGLAAQLNQTGVQILTGAVDGQMINDMTKRSYWEGFEKRALMMDLEKDKVGFNGHPGYKYCPKEEITYEALEEGDVLEIGSYTFEVLDIPGHTPGHIALFDREKGILISGDHILDPITPNIAFWGFEWNILDVYFESLKKVRKLKVNLILPSHRKLITDHVKRIDELMAHHMERLDEIQAIIQDWTSIRDTACQMHWSIRSKDWEGFPDPQKWFASGEAMSHLEYLYIKGHALRRDNEGVLEYKVRQ